MNGEHHWFTVERRGAVPYNRFITFGCIPVDGRMISAPTKYPSRQGHNNYALRITNYALKKDYALKKA